MSGTTDVRRALSLDDVLAEHRRAYPDRTAVVDGDVRLTWTQLDDRVSRLAGWLHAEGFTAGDRVLWLGQNSFRLLELLLAAGRLGGLVCPVNWRLSADEMVTVHDDLEPRLVVWQEAEIGDVVRGVRSEVGTGARWVQHDADGPATYEDAIAADHPPPPGGDVDADRPVLVLYTAAFEGRPNGALLSHTNLLAQGMVIAQLFRIDHEFVFLDSGPLFHIGTFMWAAAVFAMGGTNVFVRRVDVDEICRLIEAERCNWAFLVPPTITEIAERARAGRVDLSSLRVGQYAELWEGAAERSAAPGGRWPGGFGQTEVTGLAIWAAVGAPGAGAHGRPSPLAQVRVVDHQDRELPAGETGELVVRGAIVGHGYYNRPELNARRMAGGWWHTGDVGRREADGSITFLGTKARMVKCGVENVYPVEVERCIAAHPAVAEVAVIGVPEPGYVQAVKAIVVPQDPADPPSFEEIVEHCRAAIASYKKPRYVELVDALPRTGDGAVDYGALDRQFGGGNYPGAGTAIEG